MSTKTERPRLTRIFKVQFTEAQGSQLDHIVQSMGSSSADVIRAAVIQHYRLPTETPKRETSFHNGSDDEGRQAPASSTAPVSTPERPSGQPAPLSTENAGVSA